MFEKKNPERYIDDYILYLFFQIEYNWLEVMNLSLMVENLQWHLYMITKEDVPCKTYYNVLQYPLCTANAPNFRQEHSKF